MAAPEQVVGFLGVGQITRAMVVGLCAGSPAPPRVLLSPRGAATAAALAERFEHVSVCADNQQVADGASLLVLAVRPADVPGALGGLRVAAPTVISAVAGLSRAALTAQLPPGVEVVRAIPLPSVATRATATAIHPDHPGARVLFDRLGGTVGVGDEAAFTAMSAATGTVSALLAYVGAVTQWLAAAAAPALPGRDAEQYVRGVLAASAAELVGQEPLAQLAAAHETPGGLNEQLRTAWFDEANAAALRAALDALVARAGGAPAPGADPPAR